MRSRICRATGAIIASAARGVGGFGHDLHVDAPAVREHRDLRIFERAEEVFDPPVEFGLADADRVQRLACRSRCAGRSARRATGSAARPASASSRAARPACTRRTCRRRRNATKPGAVPCGFGITCAREGRIAWRRLFSVIVRLKRRKRSSIARSDGSCSWSVSPTACADRVFGEIVDGRTEPAGRDRAVGAIEHVGQHARASRSVLSPTECLA